MVSNRRRRPGRAGAAVLLVVGLVGAFVAAGQPSASAPDDPIGQAHGVAWVSCPDGSPNADQITDLPWPQQRYDLTELSQIADGSSVTVAVIDSGVDAGHPQLESAVLPGIDTLDRSGDGRTDCIGHGTAVASIIAARPAGRAQLRGLAPAARILPVRVSQRIKENGVVSGSGDLHDLASGIRAAVAHRPRPAVINLSISTIWDDAEVREAIREAIAADIVVVAAVGNEHDKHDPTPYPAAYDGVVGVGSIGADGLRTPTSQVGKYVDIMAPGDQVIAAAPQSGQARLQGTSFATPFVAGTAALIRDRWPSLSQAEVVRRLLATADPAPGARPSQEYGFGVLNPVRALTEIVPDHEGPAVAPPTGPGPAPRAVVAADPGLVRRALGIAGAVIVLAVALAVTAAAVPAARRRRWRPGRLDA